MGMEQQVVCKNCGRKYTRREGPSMTHELLHCDTCGKEKWRERDYWNPEDPMDKKSKCRCGGTFSIEAQARCPKCKSGDFEAADDGFAAMYD